MVIAVSEICHERKANGFLISHAEPFSAVKTVTFTIAYSSFKGGKLYMNHITLKTWVKDARCQNFYMSWLNWKRYNWKLETTMAGLGCAESGYGVNFNHKLAVFAGISVN